MPTTPRALRTAEATDLEIKNILLVDDDEALADTLKELLEAHNFIVTTAANGVDALHEVMAFDFDVIICDMVMPEMPGDMFYLAVQKAKPEMARRFFFITGNAGNPKIESFLRSIDALVIEKPVQTDELVRMISLVLQRTAAQAHL